MSCHRNSLAIMTRECLHAANLDLERGIPEHDKERTDVAKSIIRLRDTMSDTRLKVHAVL